MTEKKNKPEDTVQPHEVTPPASAPVQSPALTANQATELPQAPTEEDAKAASAKKSAAKKAVAKKEAAKKSAAKKSGAKKRASTELSATEVAEQIVAGSNKWMSGRERDELLAKEGYDLDEVRREVTRVRAKKLAEGNA